MARFGLKIRRQSEMISYGFVFRFSLLFEHDLFRKPTATPDQVRGRHFRDHALKETCLARGAELRSKPTIYANAPSN